MRGALTSLIFLCRDMALPNTGGALSSTSAALNTAGVTVNAVNPVNGAVSTGIRVIDDFGTDDVIEIILDNTGTGNGTLVDWDLLPGPGVASPAALPTGLTVTSPFSSVANLRDFFNKVPCRVDGVQLDTSDAANNYSATLKLADIRPNNTPQERVVRLSNYRVGNGGGVYQNVINVSDQLQNFQLNNQKRFRIGKIQAGSILIIRLSIPATARGFVYDDVKY